MIAKTQCIFSVIVFSCCFTSSDSRTYRELKMTLFSCSGWEHGLHFLTYLVPHSDDWEVLLVNRSGRPRKVSQSISPLGSDDVCFGRDDCKSDACLQWLRADRKAICVQPLICRSTGNPNWKGRRRPVGCHIGSMLLFAVFHQAAAPNSQGEKGKNKKN